MIIEIIIYYAKLKFNSSIHSTRTWWNLYIMNTLGQKHMIIIEILMLFSFKQNTGIMDSFNTSGMGSWKLTAPCCSYRYSAKVYYSKKFDKLAIDKLSSYNLNQYYHMCDHILLCNINSTQLAAAYQPNQIL